MNPGRIALTHAKLVMFIIAVLAVFGLHSYLVAPQSMFPAMSFSRIDVVAEVGDLPPDQVRTAVTRPIEQAVETLPGVLRVRGTSSQGSAEVLAEFDPATDPRVDLQYVDQALAQAQPTIAQAKSIDAIVVNPNSEPVVSYALVSPVLSQAVLRQFAETRIVPALYGIPGLGRVLLVGGPKTEFHVELDAAAIGAVGLSAQDVAAAIADTNAVQSVGTGVTHFQRYVFLIDASLRDVASIKRIPIPLKDGSTLPLSSLATVNLGVAPLTAQASFDARHAVLLSAYGLPGANAVRMSGEFDRRLMRIAKRLGRNVTITRYWDQTRLIVDSQKSLRDAILLGALFAVLVIYLFLRNARMTFIAAAVIPLAMALAVLLLERSGQSLNLMSVGGLAVAVGLIIDDAIVVIENIARHFAEEEVRDRGATIARALGELARPMVASTATTVVVFAPLALLGGVTGYFFRALAFTLGASLVVSLTLALFVTPILANVLLRQPRVKAESSPRALLALYEPLLRWALQHKAAVVAAAVGSLAVTAWLLASLPSDFLPSLNEGEFEIRYAMPTGVSLAASDAAATTMERLIAADRDVVGEGRITGVDTNGFSPTQPNTGTIRISLRPGAPYEESTERLRAAIETTVPAATLDFHQILEDQINDLSGAPSPISITIAGADQEKLLALAGKLTQKIAQVPGVVDPFNGIVYDDPAIHIAPASGQLAQLGLQNADLASAISAQTQGLVATSIAQESRTVPVRVRIGGPALTAAGAGGVSLFTRSGAPALGAVATISAPALASDINDENDQRVVRVTANIGGASLSSVVAGIKAQIASLEVPLGYTVTIGGAYQAQQQSFREFFKVFALAVTLVFAVMLANFGSLRLPLVILTAIPLALIGVALALFITRTPFNVSSFMGLLLLIGIVVKNGILLIDVANKQRQAGASVDDALVTAGKERLRPIVMTTLAAIAGLLPLALGNGSGAEMQKPLAIAVIGGLSTATIFTLVVIPVLYSMLIGGARVRRVSAVAAAIAFAFATLSRPAQAQPVELPAVPTPLAFVQFTLEDAQLAALGHSPDVAQAAAAFDVAHAQSDQARGSFGLSSALAYAENPQGGGSDTIASRTSSAGLQLSMADLLAYRPAVLSALALERAAEADLATAQRQERVKTIGLYYAALKSRAIASARADALALAGTQREAATKRVAAGDAPHLDVVRAQVQVARAQADLALAQATDGNATDALERETQTTALAVSPGALLPPTLEMPSPAAAVTSAQRLRSDLRSAREMVLAAQAAVEAARLAALPPVTLSGGYVVGVDSGTHIAGPSLGAQLTFPVSSAARAKVAAQRAQVVAAQAKALSVERAIVLEVAAAARNAAAAVEAERASADALRSAREELQATDLGYRNGVSSSLEVSAARSVYEQAVIDALSATYDRIAAQATLRAEVAPQ